MPFALDNVAAVVVVVVVADADAAPVADNADSGKSDDDVGESKLNDVFVHCSNCCCNALPSQGNDTVHTAPKVCQRARCEKTVQR